MTISTGGWVNAVAFSSDSTRIVSCGKGLSSLQVWNASTGVEIGELRGHTATVLSVAFSSDNTQIASGSLDKSVQVWS